MTAGELVGAQRKTRLRTPCRGGRVAARVQRGTPGLRTQSTSPRELGPRAALLAQCVIRVEGGEGLEPAAPPRRGEREPEDLLRRSQFPDGSGGASVSSVWPVLPVPCSSLEAAAPCTASSCAFWITAISVAGPDAPAPTNVART